MSTKREPLFSDDNINEQAQLAIAKCQPDANPMFIYVLAAMDTRDEYEAARAKDAELIQNLVDALDANAGYTAPISAALRAEQALYAAAAAGFKPSEP
jgi:hypothetical protein